MCFLPYICNTSSVFRIIAQICVIITQSVLDMLCLFCRLSHPPFIVVSISNRGCGSASVMFRQLISSQLQSLFTLSTSWHSGRLGSLQRIQQCLLLSPSPMLPPPPLPTLHEELGMREQVCFSLRNDTSHLMHSLTLTFNHLNSMLLLLSSYYCYLSPTRPHEELHRRAEKSLESFPL